MKKTQLLLILLILPLIIYFWPAQLYGDTTYLMLIGDSMKGTIDSGTFIIIKPDKEYLMGDIIGFVNENGKNVVHRIVDIPADGFITKGDNNPKNDPITIHPDSVIGRTIFVVPFVGFTSIFIQTPLGMSIFGIWALAMFMIKKPDKMKKNTRESFTIFKIGLISVIANYIITQSTLGMNILLSDSMTIPFSNYLEPNTANTITFCILMMTIIGLYYLVRMQDKKNKGCQSSKINSFIRSNSHHGISNNQHIGYFSFMAK